VLALEVRHAALQLDELRLAEGSPGGAAMEDDQGTSSPTHLVERHGLPRLVRQYHIGETFPDGGANGAEIDAKVCDCRHLFSFSWSYGDTAC